MNRPGGDIREVPEPGLIATHALVGLRRSLVAGLGLGIGAHRITDTSKLDQVGIRLSADPKRWMNVTAVGGMGWMRTGIPFEACDLSYSLLANRSQLPLPLACS